MGFNFEKQNIGVTRGLVTGVTGFLATPMFSFSKLKSVKPIRCYSTPEQVPIWYNIMSTTRINCDVRNLIRLIRNYVWNSTSFKGKTYFYKKPICVCLLYAISIYYVYLLCVLESCVVCICMYPCSKHDICIYMLCLTCFLCLCYVDCCSLSFSCLSLVEEDWDKCYRLGTQWRRMNDC